MEHDNEMVTKNDGKAYADDMERQPGQQPVVIIIIININKIKELVMGLRR